MEQKDLNIFVLDRIKKTANIVRRGGKKMSPLDTSQHGIKNV